MKMLRPLQIVALDLLKKSLASGCKRPMLQCPTGFGKTVLASAIVQGALSKGNRVIFCVPAISLIDQTVRSFYADGITDVGVFQGNHELTNPAKPVQIASIQTLSRRRIPHADIVVIDEAHRWFEFYETWMNSWDRIPFVGLSATPWTKGLGKYYDDLIIAATTEDLIDQGYLSGFRVYAPSHPDLTGVRTVAGDFHEGDLSQAMNKNNLVADIVTTWKQLGEDRPTLCFGVDRAHAKHLQTKFQDSGIPTGYIDAYTDTETREEIRKDFHSGKLKIVCNVGCLTTGVDWDVRCIVLARPTKSEMLFVQIIGRGLRTADGKDDCLILDHSDTHTRLGFVTDIHHEKLDDGKLKPKADRKEREKLPVECSQCTYLKPPKVNKCPACGFAPKKQSQIETEDGELLEIKRKATKAQKQKWYSMLLYIAQDRGYSDGWVSHTYREKFGVWPNSLSHTVVEPDQEVSNFVKHKLIKFSKRKVA